MAKIVEGFYGTKQELQEERNFVFSLTGNIDFNFIFQYWKELACSEFLNYKYLYCMVLFLSQFSIASSFTWKPFWKAQDSKAIL